MKNLRFPFGSSFFKTKKAACLSWAAVLLIAMLSREAPAQANLSAQAVLEKINRAETVFLEGATIDGDLDFTLLDKKYKGGSYGTRRGLVKEFYTKLKAPFILRNCTVKGGVVTRRNERTLGVLKEFFVAFDAEVVFENCRFEGEVAFEELTFYQGLTINNCIFKDDLVFEKVHFSMLPKLAGNMVAGRLVNEKTNWPGEGRVLSPPPARSGNEVTVVLKNPTFRTIKIKFGNTKWSLSPKGESTLLTQEGQEVYLWENGSLGRLLFTASKDLDGRTLDVSKL